MHEPHRSVLDTTLSLARSRFSARALAAAVSVVVCAGWGTPALATSPSGQLDPSFGTGGEVTTDFSGGGSDDWARAAAIAGNGKILTAGYSDASGNYDFALAQYKANGALDTSFSSTGTVLTDFSGSGSVDIGAAVVLQPDGKVVVAGSSVVGGNFDFALARYTANGALDASFNSTGTVLTDFGGSANDLAAAIAIQPDGKIIVAGRSIANGSTDFALARYKKNGALDKSFNSTGTVLTDFGGSGGDDEAFGVAVQWDGKIVAAGGSGPAANDFAVARYKKNGALDTSFNSTGTVLTDFSGTGSYDQASDLAIQANGKIVAVGFSDASSVLDFALARYKANGTLDTSFNSTGMVLTDFNCPGSNDQANAVAIQSDAKILAAGACLSTADADFALARYKTNGALDTSFNSTGKVTTDFSGSGSDEAALAIAIQRDGKIVAAGPSNAGGSYDFALVRYSS